MAKFFNVTAVCRPDENYMVDGTVNSFAQIFSCSIDIAAQVSLSASARHRYGNHSAEPPLHIKSLL